YRAYVDKVSKIVRFGFRLPQGGAVVPGFGWRDDEIADIVQEVFARSFSHSARASYDGERDYAPYLYAVARNVLTDRARRVGRELPMAWSAFAKKISPRTRTSRPGRTRPRLRRCAPTSTGSTSRSNTFTRSATSWVCRSVRPAKSWASAGRCCGRWKPGCATAFASGCDAAEAPA